MIGVLRGNTDTRPLWVDGVDKIVDETSLQPKIALADGLHIASMGAMGCFFNLTLTPLMIRRDLGGE